MDVLEGEGEGEGEMPRMVRVNRQTLRVARVLYFFRLCVSWFEIDKFGCFLYFVHIYIYVCMCYKSSVFVLRTFFIITFIRY